VQRRAVQKPVHEAGGEAAGPLHEQVAVERDEALLRQPVVDAEVVCRRLVERTEREQRDGDERQADLDDRAPRRVAGQEAGEPLGEAIVRARCAHGRSA
jgi:hypothetical protein